MNYINALIFAPLGLAVLLMVRNELVYRARTNAAELVHAANRRLIQFGRYGVGGFWPLYESFVSYSWMILDLRKWTFNQFYPGLKQEVSA